MGEVFEESQRDLLVHRVVLDEENTQGNFLGEQAGFRFVRSIGFGWGGRTEKLNEGLLERVAFNRLVDHAEGPAIGGRSGCGLAERLHEQVGAANIQ